MFGFLQRHKKETEAKPERKSPNSLTGPEDIGKVLNVLHKTHEILTLRFEGHADAYNSMVIAHDTNQQRFSLDELTPKKGNRMLLESSQFTILSSYHQVPIHIDCRRPEGKKDKKGLSFELPYPQMIHMDQRRNAYRARISQNLQPIARLQSPALGRELTGNVIDISTGGCAIEFRARLVSTFEDIANIEHCNIRFGSSLNISCVLRVRHPRYERQSRTTICGFEFDGLSAAEQKQINRYSLHVQRQTMRYAKRHED